MHIIYKKFFNYHVLSFLKPYKRSINGEENTEVHLKSLLSHKFYNSVYQLKHPLACQPSEILLYYPNKIV